MKGKRNRKKGRKGMDERGRGGGRGMDERGRGIGGKGLRE